MEQPPHDTVDRWISAMQARRRKNSTGLRAMAPWDELTYFDLPHAFLFPVGPGSAGVQFLGAESRRVALAVSCTSGGPAFISPIIEPVSTNGIQITQGTLPYGIIQKDWGNLVQSTWFAGATVAATLYVIEVTLREWSVP